MITFGMDANAELFHGLGLGVMLVCQGYAIIICCGQMQYFVEFCNWEVQANVLFHNVGVKDLFLYIDSQQYVVAIIECADTYSSTREVEFEILFRLLLS